MAVPLRPLLLQVTGAEYRSVPTPRGLTATVRVGDSSTVETALAFPEFSALTGLPQRRRRQSRASPPRVSRPEPLQRRPATASPRIDPMAASADWNSPGAGAPTALAPTVAEHPDHLLTPPIRSHDDRASAGRRVRAQRHRATGPVTSVRTCRPIGHTPVTCGDQGGHSGPTHPIAAPRTVGW